jgi:hypothetical protein
LSSHGHFEHLALELPLRPALEDPTAVLAERAYQGANESHRFWLVGRNKLPRTDGHEVGDEVRHQLEVVFEEQSSVDFQKDAGNRLQQVEESGLPRAVLGRSAGGQLERQLIEAEDEASEVSD